jgi:NAD(P)-dependent dehydrogenase (short-subunit alcohol dehydrogenase family)
MICARKGEIVNVSPFADNTERTAQIAYLSAKATVIQFSRRLAVEMAPHRITADCLAPARPEKSTTSAW